MRCPNCGFNSSKTARLCGVRGKDKIGFVMKYFTEIGKYGITEDLLLTARKELGYSDKTIGNDIRSSLTNEYDRYLSRPPRKAGNHK